MAEVIVARDLMLDNFRVMPADQSLHDAMEALRALQSDPQVPNVLGIVDSAGRFEGLLTARLVFKSLLTLWMPSGKVLEDEAKLEHELLEVVTDRGQLAIHDALIRGLPTAAPDDRLLGLIESTCEQRLEFLPVVDGDQLVGVVPVTALFAAAASLALTPADEGIRFERDS